MAEEELDTAGDLRGRWREFLGRSGGLDRGRRSTLLTVRRSTGRGGSLGQRRADDGGRCGKGGGSLRLGRNEAGGGCSVLAGKATRNVSQSRPQKEGRRKEERGTYCDCAPEILADTHSSRRAQPTKQVKVPRPIWSIEIEEGRRRRVEESRRRGRRGRRRSGRG